MVAFFKLIVPDEQTLPEMGLGRWSQHALERFQERFGEYAIPEGERERAINRIEDQYRPMFDRLAVKRPGKSIARVGVNLWSASLRRPVTVCLVYDFKTRVVITAMRREASRLAMDEKWMRGLTRHPRPPDAMESLSA